MIDTDKYEGHTEGKREIQHNAFIHIEGRGLYATIAGGFTTADGELIADAPLLLAEVKRLQAYKEFADAVVEWSHGASYIHFLAEQVNHIRRTSQYDDDAMNHGCQQYYNGPNASSQVSDKEYKDLLAEVERLRNTLLIEEARTSRLWNFIYTYIPWMTTEATDAYNGDEEE